jgi:hypothetical protein
VSIATARKEQAVKENDSRVLMRQGARELTQEELDCVTGAVHTATKCTFDPATGHKDGDLGEC